MALDYKFLRCIWLICLCLCDYHCKVGSMKKGHLSSVKRQYFYVSITRLFIKSVQFSSTVDQLWSGGYWKPFKKKEKRKKEEETKRNKIKKKERKRKTLRCCCGKSVIGTCLSPSSNILKPILLVRYIT